MPIYYTSTNFVEEDMLYCVIGPYNMGWHEFDSTKRVLKNLAGTSFPDVVFGDNGAWNSKGSFCIPNSTISRHGFLCAIDQKDFFPADGCTTLEISATCYSDSPANAILIADYDSGGFGYHPKDNRLGYWGRDSAGAQAYRTMYLNELGNTCDGQPHTWTFQNDNTDPNKTTLEVYVDGVIKHSSTLGYKFTHGSAANTYLGIGVNPSFHSFGGGSTENLHGDFHDCIIYSRKLTSAEIEINYLYHRKIMTEVS